MRRPVVLCLLAAAAAGSVGCGGTAEPPAAPAACVSGPATLARALRAAPDPVRLPGGTRLSDCIASARQEADVQGAGISFIQLADAIAVPAARNPELALRLGYLLGAVSRGGRHAGGHLAQLVHRIESDAAPAGNGPPAVRAALARGMAAGERTG